MLAYPEIESWNEFYPSEIFLRMSIADDDNIVVETFKKAKVGAKIYFALSDDETLIYKKVGEFETQEEMYSNLVLLGDITMKKNNG